MLLEHPVALASADKNLKKDILWISVSAVGMFEGCLADIQRIGPMSEVDIFWTSTGLPCVMWDTTSSQQFCSHFSIRTHSEAEPNDHDLSIEERSKSNDNKQWY